MKKITAILLAFSILLSTLGIGIGINYCPMKETYSFSVIKEAKSCCCKSSNKRNCCKSQKITFKKIEDNYIASGFQFKVPQIDFILYQHPVVINGMSTSIKATALFENFNPPEPPISLSILYRSILI